MSRTKLAKALSVPGPAGTGELVAYQATSLNTPCRGYSGQVVFVQACSTNATGTVTVNAITDLSVDGKTVSFTNQLASLTLVDGVAQSTLSSVYVAPNQRITVSGTAFPGGSVILWIKR